MITWQWYTVYFRLAWFPVIPGSDTHDTLLWDREGGKHSWVLSNIIINPSQVYCMPTIFPMQQCFLLVYLSHSPPSPSPSPSPPPPPPPSIFLTQFVLVTVPHPSPGYTPTPWSVTGHSRCEERNSPGPGLLTESFMALYLYTTCDCLSRQWFLCRQVVMCRGQSSSYVNVMTREMFSIQLTQQLWCKWVQYLYRKIII